MKGLEITITGKVHQRNIDLLLKAPLLPNQYLYKSHGVSLALYGRNEDDPYYLITDNDVFYNTYKPYYEQRFKVAEIDGNTRLPEGYMLMMGEVHSTDTTPPSQTQDETQKREP